MADSQSSGFVPDLFGYSPRRSRRVGRDPQKVKANARRHYERHRERILAVSAERQHREKVWLKPGRREQRIEYKRRKRREKAAADGRVLRPATPKGQGRPKSGPTWQRNAREAWRWWLNIKATDRWVSAYYSAMGKPWNNPRLSAGERYRLRYQHDAGFYHREYARLQVKKVRHRAATAFGVSGVRASDVRAFRESNQRCAYCGVWLDMRHRTIDHVVPLANGGEHCIENFAVACRPCNSSKGKSKRYFLLMSHTGATNREDSLAAGLHRGRFPIGHAR